MDTLVKKLIRAVKQEPYRVPRNPGLPTSKWNVDSWRRGPVRVIALDDGYHILVLAPGLEVAVGYDGKREFTEYKFGSVDTVKEVMAQLEIE